MIKVTIAIAVYNVEKYIEKCISTALNQDFEDYEILVVDDRGPDNSISLVEQMAKSHPNGDKIRIFHHENNLGTGGVRNTCIDEARGEYLFFMDGDDYLGTNSIRMLYDAMMSNPADIVMGNYQLVSPDGKVISTSNFAPGRIESEYAIANWMSNNKTNFYPVATWNKLFRTSFLRENGFRCVPWHRQEDILFALETAFVVKSIVTIPEVTYYWIQVPGSCLHQDTKEWHLNQYLDIFDKSIALFKDMEHEKAGKLPKEVYWIVSSRYLSGFVTTNVWKSSSLSYKQKNDYLKHVREITAYIKKKDEYDWKQRFFYTLIEMPFPYLIIKVLSSIAHLLKIKI